MKNLLDYLCEPTWRLSYGQEDLSDEERAAKKDQYRQEARQYWHENLVNTFKFLHEKGVAKVSQYYAGYGDSGDIESINYFAADGQPIDDHFGEQRVPNVWQVRSEWDHKTNSYTKTHIPVTVNDFVTNILWTLLERQFPGWEINEGSSGTFEFDVVTHEAIMQHASNYTAITEYDAEFAIDFNAQPEAAPAHFGY